MDFRPAAHRAGLYPKRVPRPLNIHHDSVSFFSSFFFFFFECDTDVARYVCIYEKQDEILLAGTKQVSKKDTFFTYLFSYLTTKIYAKIHFVSYFIIGFVAGFIIWALEHKTTWFLDSVSRIYFTFLSFY
jgi:hypothetical protein